MARKGIAIFASRMDRGTLPILAHASDLSARRRCCWIARGPGTRRVVLYAYSATSYVARLAGEEAFRTRIMERAKAGAVVLAAAALADALEALDVHRLAVVHPPWYSEELNDMGKLTFRERIPDRFLCPHHPSTQVHRSGGRRGA